MQASKILRSIAALSRSCAYLHSETKPQPTAITWLNISKESNSMLAKMLLLTATLPWPSYSVGLICFDKSSQKEVPMQYEQRTEGHCKVLPRERSWTYVMSHRWYSCGDCRASADAILASKCALSVSVLRMSCPVSVDNASWLLLLPLADWARPTAASRSPARKGSVRDFSPSG